MEPLRDAKNNGRKVFRAIQLNGVTYWKINDDVILKDISGDEVMEQ